MPNSAVSIAILYAGRWFGRTGQHFVDNHLSNLIGPATAFATVSVFLVASPDQWCTAAKGNDTAALKAALAAEVRDMFGPRVTTHSELAPPPLVAFSEARVEGTISNKLLRAAQKAASDGGGKPGHASAMKYGMLLGYMSQFSNVARAEELRQMAGTPHDVIIKARIDVQYPQPVDVAPLWSTLRSAPKTIFATQVYNQTYDPEISTPQWRDWNLVLSEAGAIALHQASDLDNGSSPIYDPTRRCYGYCIEEQLKLQLERRGFTYRNLPWQLMQHRIYHRAHAGETPEEQDTRIQRTQPTTEAARGSAQCSVAGNRAEAPTNGQVFGELPRWG